MTAAIAGRSKRPLRFLVGLNKLAAFVFRRRERFIFENECRLKYLVGCRRLAALFQQMTAGELDVRIERIRRGVFMIRKPNRVRSG